MILDLRTGFFPLISRSLDLLGDRDSFLSFRHLTPIAVKTTSRPLRRCLDQIGRVLDDVSLSCSESVDQFGAQLQHKIYLNMANLNYSYEYKLTIDSLISAIAHLPHTAHNHTCQRTCAIEISLVSEYIEIKLKSWFLSNNFD